MKVTNIEIYIVDPFPTRKCYAPSTPTAKPFSFH